MNHIDINVKIEYDGTGYCITPLDSSKYAEVVVYGNTIEEAASHLEQAINNVDQWEKHQS